MQLRSLPPTPTTFRPAVATSQQVGRLANTKRAAQRTGRQACVYVVDLVAVGAARANAAAGLVGQQDRQQVVVVVVAVAVWPLLLSAVRPRENLSAEESKLSL